MAFYKEPYKLLTKREIELYSGRYDYPKEPPPYKQARFLTKDEFVKIADWKTSRQLGNYNDNNPKFVEEVTSAAFDPKATEEFRIGVLTLLKGVQYPVASAILHFGYDSTYPIIDFRALWTLWREKSNKPRYNAELWVKYVEICREIAFKIYNLDHPKDPPIRMLDKALWKYSDENQLGQLTI